MNWTKLTLKPVTNMVTLTPAYGRDYKSQAEVLAHFDEGKDFVINCIFDKWDGKVCNLMDLVEGGYKQVKFRYRGGAMVFHHMLPTEIEECVEYE